jgi:nitroimidazol reductase NimA-like FMN-containing flavoprotein (pyridoxamine 5'-phosphate oxidase superfamily)
MSVTDGWFPGQLRDLSESECLQLLASRSLGRLAYLDDDGPVVLPVNYVVHDGTVLFRTSPHSAVGRIVPTQTAGFEVDDIDEDTRSGWSVLVRGPATVVEVDELPATAEDRPSPWVDGVRTLHVRITPRSISGRRLLPVP